MGGPITGSCSKFHQIWGKWEVGENQAGVVREGKNRFSEERP